MINALYYLIPVFFILSFSTWMMRIRLENGPGKAVAGKKNPGITRMAPDADRPAKYGFVPFAIRNAA